MAGERRHPAKAVGHQLRGKGGDQVLAWAPKLSLKLLLVGLTILVLGIIAGSATPRVADAQAMAWVASDAWSGGFEGPQDTSGRPWHHPEFDDSAWAGVSMPDVNSIPGGSDRFYRARFTVVDPSLVPPIYFESDDGIWIYVNGTLVGHWGGAWRMGGCVNRCFTGVTVSPQDISAFLVPGSNTIAVMVSNGPGGSYFDLRLETESMWRMSEPWNGSFEGPTDSSSRPWYQADFDDSNWSAVALPDQDSFSAGYDRFYRTEFELSSQPGTYPVSFASDDGIWIYVNGTFVGHWGADWRVGGCVNQSTLCLTSISVDPQDIATFLVVGRNAIAVRVSNGQCCNSYFDFEFPSLIPQQLDLAQASNVTVPGIIPAGSYSLGTYVSGGSGLTGTSPPDSWSFSRDSFFDPTAANGLDHHWIQGTSTPVIWDVGSGSTEAIVFPSIDHGPVPYEALEFTVWGSNDPLAAFPTGWTLSSLTRVYEDGWIDVGTSQESDDWVSVWSFPSTIRYVAVYANESVHITPDNSFKNDCLGQEVWCSFDHEVDAVGAPSVPVPRKAIFIQGIDSWSVMPASVPPIDCGSSYENGQYWMRRERLNGQLPPGLLDDSDVIGFSYSGEWCDSASRLQPRYLRSDTCYGVRLYAQLLDELVRNYPLSRFDIIGHSLGALIAAYWATGGTDSENFLTDDPEFVRERLHSIITIDSPLQGIPGGLPPIFLPSACPDPADILGRCAGTAPDTQSWRDLMGCDPLVLDKISEEEGGDGPLVLTGKVNFVHINSTPIGDLLPGYWRSYSPGCGFIDHSCILDEPGQLREPLTTLAYEVVDNRSLSPTGGNWDPDRPDADNLAARFTWIRGTAAETDDEFGASFNLTFAGSVLRVTYRGDRGGRITIDGTSHDLPGDDSCTKYEFGHTGSGSGVDPPGLCVSTFESLGNGTHLAMLTPTPGCLFLCAAFFFDSFETVWPSDLDADGVSDVVDNCPFTSNPVPADSDSDGRGDACDFTDLPNDHWARAYIEALFDAGITAGCDTDPLRYCPSEPVTRAQMAAFLLRAMGHADHLPSYQNYFSDVPSGVWFTGFVEHLFEHGVTGGCATSPLRYCPNDSVSRAQMAAFLLRGIAHADHLPAFQGIFDDVAAGLWFTGFVEHLSEHAITGGCSASPPLYCPGSAVTRAQMAAFIVRAWDLALAP